MKDQIVIIADRVITTRVDYYLGIGFVQTVGDVRWGKITARFKLLKLKS